MEAITHGLARHATELPFESLPGGVVEKTKQLFLDLLGVAIRASVDAESTPPIREALATFMSPGPSSLIGEPGSASPMDAVFYNATLAHSLDFDDTHREGSVHPGAAVIPTVLAVGEAEGSSGAQAIAAAVVGYDITCRLAVAIDPKSHYERGFHPTATCGVFGATAAAGRLAGLTTGQLEQAFGINGSQAAGSLQFFDNGAWNKRIHPGLAARNALLAVSLARAGFLGASHPIEGEHGLLHGYSDASTTEPLTKGLGRRFDVMATAIKPYPACRYAHAPLDAIIEIAQEHDLKPEEVTAIQVGLSDAGLALIGRPIERKREPQNIVDAQFSMPFLAAVAMTRRRLTWSDYDALADPGIRELARRVDVSADAEANRLFPGRWLASVTIEARGRTFTDRRWRTRGEPESPLTWAEVEAKFNELTESALGSRREHVVELVRGLEHVDDLRTLGQLLRSNARPADSPSSAAA
jgi:2-methylcitrate dehydratase PrpD